MPNFDYWVLVHRRSMSKGAREPQGVKIVQTYHGDYRTCLRIQLPQIRFFRNLLVLLRLIRSTLLIDCKKLNTN